MDRISNELAHGRRISGKPEFYWGWSGVAGRLRAGRRAGMFVAAGGLAPGKKALEIGCGTGIFTHLTAESGADITAIDLSPELVELARGGGAVPNAKFLVMNVEKLDFRDASFDCVYGSSVLHHLDLAKALPEMLRVLRPGGTLVFTEPNMLNPQIMVQKNVPFIKKAMGDSPDETAFFRWGLAGRLGEYGLKDIRIEPFDFLHPWIPGPLTGAARRIGAVLERLPLLREIAGSLLVTAEK